MAAKLAAGKSVTRELNLRFLTKPVNVTLSQDGLTIAAKRHKPIYISWDKIVEHSFTPQNVPAKLYQQGLKYLESCMKA